MNTVYEYLKFYNNLSFNESCFNDMDNIVFSTLAYLPLETIALKPIMSIKELSRTLKISDKKDNSMKSKSIKLLKEMAKGKRYQTITISNFVSITDEKTQFSAMAIRVEKGQCYIAFRGTDNSIIGWKEDFDLSYKYPVPAQTLATEYLKNNIKYGDKTVYIGGHSKGGNLAMASVMEVENNLYKKIDTVYNNDGPGFLSPEFNSDKFKRMTKKLKMFLPEESIVGILLLNTNSYQVVKSKERGPYQHDLTSWVCFGQFLLEGRLSTASIKMQAKLNAWLEETENEHKQLLVETFFKIIKQSGIKEFRELKEMKWPQISAMIKEAKGINENSKKLLSETLMTIASIDSKGSKTVNL